MKKTLVIILLLGAVLILNCKRPNSQGKQEHSNVPAEEQKKIVQEKTSREKAIDFTLTGLDGVERTLSQQKGKVVLVDFWATWCRPCIVEIPHLKELYATYKDQGLVMWGVGLDQEGKLRQFVYDYDIEYPILIGNKSVAQQYNVQGIPTSILFDKHNKIAYRHVGFAPGMEENFKKEIAQLLSE